MMDEKITDESLMLKDMLKEKRDRFGVSNQEIADASGLSIYTVTNYFSSRSKAASAYTVGKICLALHMSFDRAFGIIPDEYPEELNENVRKIEELKKRCQEYEKGIENKDEIIAIKDDVIRELRKAVSKRRPLIYSLLIIIALLIILFGAYFIYDLINPWFGVWR